MILYIDDIADRLRVSRKTVYTLINEKGLADYLIRIGSRYAIKERDLEKYLDSTRLK